MTSTPLRRRVAAATAGVAIVASTIAVGSAAEATTRHALTSQDTTYLADTLGLPADTVVETVTYDRFSWLLKQPGQFAFVVGSTNDPGFKAKIIQADAAAKAAGASKLYWFDPNLSGYTDNRNLDTRNPAGINLVAATQTLYGNTWKNLLGQYLGNGIKATPNAGQTTVAIAADDTIVNDAVDPVWDYRTTATPAVTTSDDILFVYDKDHQVEGAADKVVDWVNLSTTSTENTPAEIASAFTAIGGGAQIDQLSQFDWWKSAANFKHDLAYGDDARYGGDIIEDSDNADGWRIHQVTYPELLHLLNDRTEGANYAILFGGTWCHNTRAVIKQVNKEAQATGVQTVYNFDFVLDGGTTKGTNGGDNPLHIRDNRNSGGTNNFRPSYLYGDVVNTYFPNVVTELAGVSYYPGGDLTAATQTALKGQVPFLLHYERGTGDAPSATAVKSQWIKDLGGNKYKEYMSEWWFTQPSAQLGLSFAIPEDESTLTTSQKGQLTNARNNAAFGAEAVAKLTEFFDALPHVYAADNLEVESPDVEFGNAATIALTVPDTEGYEPSGTATLTIDGTEHVQAIAENVAAFSVEGLAVGTHDYTVDYASDPHIQAFSLTGSVTVTKTNVASVAGAVGTAPTPQKAGTYAVTVTQPAGLPAASGEVQVTLTSGSATKTVTGTVAEGSATVALPALAAGTWNASVAYAGNGDYLAKTAPGASVVSAKSATTVAGAVVTKPTPQKAGSYKVTVTQPSGLAKASGSVKVTLKNGSSTKTINGSLSGGAVTVALPKLPVGTWTASVAYAGDGNYLAKTATGASVVSAKSAVSKVGAKVTKKPTTTKAGSYKITVTQPSGLAKASGKVKVTLKKGKTTKTINGTLSGGAVTVTLPKLAAGTWKASVAYAGDANYNAKTVTGASVVSSKTAVSKVTTKVTKKPTTTKAGSYKVTVTQPKGLAKATGKVTVKLKKGKTTKTVKGTLKAGVVTISVPKLAKGTWKASVAYGGSDTYSTKTATGTSIKVTK